jgi:hypothetical protein
MKERETKVSTGRIRERLNSVATFVTREPVNNPSDIASWKLGIGGGGGGS